MTTIAGTRSLARADAETDSAGGSLAALQPRRVDVVQMWDGLRHTSPSRHVRAPSGVVL